MEKGRLNLTGREVEEGRVAIYGLWESGEKAFGLHLDAKQVFQVTAGLTREEESSMGRLRWGKESIVSNTKKWMTSEVMRNCLLRRLGESQQEYRKRVYL